MDDCGMEQEDLERLGRLVVERRKEQGWATREQFASNIDLTYRVLTDLENGKRRLGPKAYSSVERALDWLPGSVDAVLRGDAPSVRDSLVTVAEVEGLPRELDVRGLSQDSYRFLVSPNEYRENLDLAMRQIARAQGELADGDDAAALDSLLAASAAIQLVSRSLDITVNLVPRLQKEENTDDQSQQAPPTSGSTEAEGEKTGAGNPRDGGTDPEGQAADDARPNVWREKPDENKADDLIGADQASDVDANTAQSDVDLAGRDVGGISEGEAIRRRMDEQAEQGGA